MTNDAELLRVVRGALIVALPDDTPHDVIEDAALNVLEALHGPWFPASEKPVAARRTSTCARLAAAQRQPSAPWRRARPFAPASLKKDGFPCWYTGGFLARCWAKPSHSK